MAFSRNNPRIGFALAAGFAFPLTIAFAPAQHAQPSPAHNGPSLPSVSFDKLAESSHLLGNPKAPITIVEIADFMCPSCQKTHQKLSKNDLDKMFASFHGKHARTVDAAQQKVAEDIKVDHAYDVSATPTCILFVDHKPVAVATGSNLKDVLKRPEFEKVVQPSPR